MVVNRQLTIASGGERVALDQLPHQLLGHARGSPRPRWPPPAPRRAPRRVAPALPHRPRSFIAPTSCQREATSSSPRRRACPDPQRPQLDRAEANPAQGDAPRCPPPRPSAAPGGCAPSRRTTSISRSTAAAHPAGAVGPVLELDPGCQAPQLDLGGRRRQLDPVGLRHLIAGVGEPVGQLAVVGQQQQPGRVGVESADRVEARRRATSSTTAGRPPGSRAVETTPAGLFTAQTSRASAPTGPPSTRTSSPSPTSRAGSVTTSPPTVTRPLSDHLLRHAPRGDPSVGEVLGEPHGLRAVMAANAVRPP